MRRFLSFFIIFIMCFATILCGCSSNQIDREKELKQAMDTCDNQWSQAFPTGSTTFQQLSNHIAGWGSNAGLKVTKEAKHYIVLTNPATKGYKKTPSVTIAIAVDPAKLRSQVSMLSLGMTSVLGPMEHGKIRLIVTEATDTEYPGAASINPKYLKCDHFIYLYKGGSDIVYTTGPLAGQGKLSCKARRTEPKYTNAFEISLQIPQQLDPYSFEKESSMPNPINVIGDLLASAKSSGRLFEIASFSAEDNGVFLPSSAKAVVVIDDNNVEAFQKKFDTSFEALTKRFKDVEVNQDEEGNPIEPLVYTMQPCDLPEKVLRSSASNNIISLMYTLQTGIHLQDEDSGAITAASYIRSVSTKDGRFSLIMDMRSRNTAGMEEMSGNYLITSGLCDVHYSSSEPKRLWACEKDSSLAAWFIATVNDENEDTSVLQSSACDIFYAKRNGLDIIAYRYDKDHRGNAMGNILSYLTSLAAQN